MVKEHEKNVYHKLLPAYFHAKSLSYHGTPNDDLPAVREISRKLLAVRRVEWVMRDLESSFDLVSSKVHDVHC